MKKLFEEQQVSIYKIQKDLNLHHCRLYRYADGSLIVDNMPVNLILQLANYFKIEPNELLRKMRNYEIKRQRKNNRRINKVAN